MTSATAATFGEMLQRFRTAAELTQEQLAERSGLSVRGIAALELGERQNPQRSTVQLLASALNLPEADRIRFEAAARSTRPARAGRRSNLPYHLTSFVGREREVALLQQALSRSRLVTLTGIGGSGKTRLALEVAAGMVDRYRDGVWLVDLSAVSEPSRVVSIAAATLSVREVPGIPLLQTLQEKLEHSHILLVLDNCEHLLSGCAELTDTLTRYCPELYILATSRQRLDVPGEMVIRVPPLPVPGPQPITLASALQVEAVRLFLERVRLVQPDFGLTEGNVPAVVRICESLEGLPLALELAAARAHVLPIERLAERLDDRFRLLSGGSRRSPPRQQTLQATIDWSYTLLSGQEQGLLRQLSVFAGGWTLEAAEAICVIDGDVLDGLSMLIDKSMVQEPESATGGRYRFLETIRDDAAQRLKKSGEQDAVRQRHAAYYLWVVETAEPELRGAQQDVWLDRLEADYDNLLAAMAWWVQRNHQEQVLRFTAALRGLWETRGPAAVGLAWLERAIQQPGGSRAARARALNAAGALAVLLGDDPRAQEFWSESLALSRMLGDRRRIAGLLNNLAHVREHTGDYAGAISYYQESLAIHQDLNNRWGVAGCYCNLGEVARRQGRYEQAVSLLGESLRLFHEVEDKASAAIVLGNLALIARTRGDYDGATALLQESFGLFQAVGDPPGVAECLEGLAGIAALRGEEERAARLGGAAEALRQSLDVPIPSDVREQYLRDIAQARDRIDHAAWNTAWTEGRALSPDQSAAYALTTDNDR